MCVRACVCRSGGEKILLHFVQDSPGDFVPLEDISKALGITTSAQAGEKPQVNKKNSHVLFCIQLTDTLIQSMVQRDLNVEPS